MPITTEKIDGLPAVLATYDGDITCEDTLQMYEDTAQLLADENGRYYRIIDVRNSTTTFEAFEQISDNAMGQQKFHTSDPNIRLACVGTNKWLVTFRAFIKRDSLQIPSFFTVEEAIDYIRIDYSSYIKVS